MRLDLTEGGPAMDVALSASQAHALAATGWVDVEGFGGGLWSISALTKVGAAVVGDVELAIAPKVPIGRLIFLLGYAASDKGWLAAAGHFGTDDGIVPAMADAFLRQLERALGPGVLQGYRTVDEALPLVRGKIRTADQLSRRYGLALPVEVTYDEFDMDIAENQILRLAVYLLRQVPGVRRQTRSTLGHALSLLIDVSPLGRGAPMPRWEPTRLNARYHVALRLAELIVASTSIEHRVGQVEATGIMLDMAKVFEDFVVGSLRDALRARGGRTAAQQTWPLDVGQVITIRPDLLWYAPDSPTPSVVVDAKYKAEKPSGFPNADVYQMLAYCTRLNLGEGHLVYAAGRDVAKEHTLVGSGVRIVQHVLDLGLDPRALLAQIDSLAARLVESSVVRPVGSD